MGKKNLIIRGFLINFERLGIMSCELNTNYWNRVLLFSSLSLSFFLFLILYSARRHRFVVKIKSSRFSSPYSLEVFMYLLRVHKKCDVEKKKKKERECAASINGERAGDRQVVWKLLIKRVLNGMFRIYRLRGTNADDI